MSASPEVQWTPEEDTIIRQSIIAGMQVKEMLPLLPRRRIRGLYCRVYALGLKSGQPRTKHSKNEAFWEVPCPLNAYYAGVLAADGSVCHDKHTLQWVCEQTDKPAMEGFVQASGFTGGVGQHIRTKSTGGLTTHTSVRVAACQKWNTDLARNFNVIPQKAHRLAPPAFSNDYLACCYLIGYTDGDGCVHPGKKTNPQIQYVSASRAIIEWIQQFVEKHFAFKMRDKPSNIRSSAEGSYHHYHIYGMVAVKLFDFLRRIDVPRFPRKWDNPAFLALVDTYRAKWPEFFALDKELTFDPAGNIVFASTLAPISIELSLLSV